MKRIIIAGIAVAVAVVIIAAIVFGTGTVAKMNVKPQGQKAATSTSAAPGQKTFVSSTKPKSASNNKITVDILKNASSMKVGEKAFSPDPVQVSVGGTLVWKNSDMVSHTLKSGSGPLDPKSGKLFDSGVIKPGATFAFKFLKAGAYDYYCSLHPSMTGKVVVS